MLTIILTGGESRRMGQDKAILETNKGLLSLALAERYSRELGPVAFSVDHKGRFPCGGFTEYEDAFPGRGPLNGLYSAFLYAREEYIFLTATDMPNGDPALVQFLLERMINANRDICTIRRNNGFLEPLFSIYRRNCYPIVKDCLEKKKLSLHELYDKNSVLAESEGSLPQWNLDVVLYNINTPQDYRRFMAGKEAGLHVGENWRRYGASYAI